MKIRKAIIPAAGLGTRVLPATKAQPKEMLCIVDKPALQYLVEELIESGIQEILIITGRNKQSIADKTVLLHEIQYISNMTNMYYVRQKLPLGLGHAITRAESFIANEPFLVLLGDDIIYTDKSKGEIPVSKQLIEQYEKLNGGTFIGVQQVPKKDLNKYGIIKPGEKINDSTYIIEDFVEKPNIEDAPSEYAALGRYILEPEIFKYLKEEEPINGEIQLTPAILKMSKNNNKLYSYNFNGLRYDTGDKFGMFKANVEFGLRHPELSDKIKEYIKELSKTL